MSDTITILEAHDTYIEQGSIYIARALVDTGTCRSLAISAVSLEGLEGQQRIDTILRAWDQIRALPQPALSGDWRELLAGRDAAVRAWVKTNYQCDIEQLTPEQSADAITRIRTSDARKRAAPPSNGNSAPPPQPAGERASTAQIRKIFATSRDIGYDDDTIKTIVIERYKCTLDELMKKDATKLIDELVTELDELKHAQAVPADLPF